MTQQPLPDRRTDPLESWDRIRKAIYGAAVNRNETMLHLPTCHRRNCQNHHSDDVDLVFRMFTDVIADSVHTELLCEAVTTPDLGPDATECTTLQDRMAGGTGPWAECEHHPRSDWVDEVTSAATQLGYWDWVRAKHDLRYGMSAVKPAPMVAVHRDEQAYAAWWDNLPEEQRLQLEEDADGLLSGDAVLAAETLNGLMLRAFHMCGDVTWLTVTGLTLRADHVATLDICPSYNSNGCLDGVDVVLNVRATVGGRTHYQVITAHVKQPRWDLRPESVNDMGATIAHIVDRATALVGAELADCDQFWRAVR